MSRRTWPTSWWWRGAVVATTFLMLAVALCLFDSDRDGLDDNRMDLCNGTDLCNVTLAVSVDVVYLVRPMLAGLPSSDPIPSLQAVALRVPDPPPRLASLS